MKTFKKSVHAPENEWLRQTFIDRRKELGLSQRALADRLDVIYSTVGKIETGDRRLDVLEFIDYCEALELMPDAVIQQFLKAHKDNPDK